MPCWINLFELLHTSNYTTITDSMISRFIFYYRASVKAVVERLTYAAYQMTARTLLERDRMVYTLLVAIEVSYQNMYQSTNNRFYLLLILWLNVKLEFCAHVSVLNVAEWTTPNYYLKGNVDGQCWLAVFKRNF